MFRVPYNKPQTQKRVPVINLSDSEDCSDQQKQNRFEGSTVSASQILKPSYQSGARFQINRSSLAAKNHLQFSTLSLEDDSLVDLDYRLRILQAEKAALSRQNQGLREEVSKLRTELASVDSNRSAELQQCEAQLQQVQKKFRKLQQDFRKAEKQYQNKLLSQQLPSKKSIAQEKARVLKQISGTIKQICSRLISDLSKQRMNSQVQQVIAKYVEQLVMLDISGGSAYQSLSLQPVSTPFRSSRLAPARQEQSEKGISSDYRLLQKSIQKLKTMEKQIDKRGGATEYKSQKEKILDKSRSVLDQSSISALDRSKSKRKRIFQ